MIIFSRFGRWPNDFQDSIDKLFDIDVDDEVKHAVGVSLTNLQFYSLQEVCKDSHPHTPASGGFDWRIRQIDPPWN